MKGLGSESSVNFAPCVSDFLSAGVEFKKAVDLLKAHENAKTVLDGLLSLANGMKSGIQSI